MTDVLEKELTGSPVTVKLAAADYPLAFSMRAVIVYKQLTGDSLFDPASWPKVDLAKDPERWLACLWAGLHVQQPDKSWKVPFTLPELEGLIQFDFAAAGEIAKAMAAALVLHFPKNDALPNAPAPVAEMKVADPALNAEDGSLQPVVASISRTSANSGSVPISGWDSAATSS